jgi:protein phosphatase
VSIVGDGGGSHRVGDRTVPADALVLLVGPAGCGKSTLAARLFPPRAILSSDAFRALVADDESDQAATPDAFRVLHAAAAGRLRRGLLTVIDATNLLAASRRPLLRLAEQHGRPRVAIVLDTPLAVCLDRAAARAGRSVPPEVVRRHHARLAPALRELATEGYLAIIRLGSDGRPLQEAR